MIYVILIIAIIIILFKKFPGLLNKVVPGSKRLVFSLINKTTNEAIASVSYDLNLFTEKKKDIAAGPISGLVLCFHYFENDQWALGITYQGLALYIPFKVKELLELKKEIDLSSTLLVRIEIV